MKKLFSALLCLCVLFTGVPLAAFAADDPIKIVSVTANTNQNYSSREIAVTFKVAADREMTGYTTGELCYTYQANGHPYTVRRRSGYASKNDDGTYTLRIDAPYGLLDDAFLKPTVAVVTGLPSTPHSSIRAAMPGRFGAISA